VKWYASLPASRGRTDHQTAHPRRLAAILTKDAPCAAFTERERGGRHSPIYLMNWADVIIDPATSVLFGGQGQETGVGGDYLHAGVRAGEYPRDWNCRDDVYRQIEDSLATAATILHEASPALCEGNDRRGGRTYYPAMWRCWKGRAYRSARIGFPDECRESRHWMTS
jgi:hypothetical protein